MYYAKYSLLNYIAGWRSFSGVSRGCVNEIRLWLLRRNDHSGVLIGAGGTRRCDWPARVQANDISRRIDRWPACRGMRPFPLRCYSHSLVFFKYLVGLYIRSNSLTQPCAIYYFKVGLQCVNRFFFKGIPRTYCTLCGSHMWQLASTFLIFSPSLGFCS